MIVESNTLIADEDIMLNNEENYSTQVYFGIYNTPSNWHEILASEIPEPMEETYNATLGELAEVARILLDI